MSDDREARIARLARIQRIQAIQDAQSQADASGQDMAGKEGHAGAFADKALNTLTMGYGPQIEAGARAALPPLAEAALMGPIAELPKMLTEHGRDELRAEYPDKSYTELRDALKARLKAQGDLYPKSSIAGNAAGFVAGAKGLSKLLPASWTAGKGLANAMKQGTAFGAGSGFLSNPGDTAGEVSPLQLKDRAINAAIGGVGGFLLSPLAYGAGKLVEYGADKLKDSAGLRAFRALGRLRPRDAQAIPEAEQARLGSKALDEGVIGNVPRGNSVIADRVAGKLSDAGGRLDTAIDAVAETADALKREGYDVGADKKAMADELRRRLIDTSEAGSPEVNSAVEKEIQHFMDAGEGRAKLDIKTAQDVASRAGKKVPWTKLRNDGYQALTPAEQVALEKYGIVKQAVTDQAEGVAKFANQPEQSEAIAQAKGDYSDYKTMDKAVQRELGLKGGRNQVGLTQRMAFLSDHNPITGLAKAALVHVADDMGPQFTAKQLANMSRAAANAGEGLQNQLIPALRDKKDVYEWLKAHAGETQKQPTSP